jgi:TolA-binding protein
VKNLILVAALCAPAFAADAPAATAAAGAPAVSAAPGAPPVVASDSPLKPADAAPAPAAVPAKAAAAPAKAVDAELKAEVAKASVKVVGPDDEWAFAKAAGQDENEDVRRAAIAELALFARRRPDSARAPDALLLLADLRQKNGDWQRALADLLHLIAEYPNSEALLRAKSDYLALVERKASRRARAALSALPSGIDATAPVDRLSQVWQALADRAPDAVYEPAVREIEDFVVRFPNHPDADKLLQALARLHAANDQPAAALLTWRKLLALCPASELRPRALKSIGDLYADSLRDPRAAIASYQDLAAQYPQAIEVQEALEKSAGLFENKLRQYDLAVEQYERVVKGFPKTPASLRALKAIARLQRDRLNNSDAAIKTLQRLSAMHGGQEGVDALTLAASVAHRDLKDSGRQAALLHQIADDYPTAKESPEALYDCGGVWEDAGNTIKAVEVYKEVATKFPSDRYARKASDRVAKLSAAKS